MKRVLCIAPHCDDETLGCGATLAKHAGAGDEVHVAVVTGHGKDPHPLWPKETWTRVRAECRAAVEQLGVKPDSALHFGELPAAQLASVPTHEKNRAVHELIARVQPAVLYVPFAFDIHLDHREIFHAASVAWRPHTELGKNIREVYAYETQSETHWNAGSVEPGFVPNVWVDVSDTLAVKVRALSKYESQMRPFPDARSIEAVEHLAKWRGAQMGMHAAEAFVLVRRLA